MSDALILNVRDLHAGYGRVPVLHGIDLSVTEGQIVGVLGHNGMGKTTLLKTLMGIVPATSGRVEFDGVDISDEPAFERSRLGLGYVPQGRGIFPQLSVYDNLRMGVVEHGEDEHEAIDTVLQEFPLLQPLLDRSGGALSGGEQQILALARCLISKPDLVFLDEPTLGLDVIAQSKIREFVKYYNNQHGTTFIITSHYTKDIQEMCERVFVLHKGKSIYDGNFNQLIKNINPDRRLIFEFMDKPDIKFINSLKENFSFTINNKILTANLPEANLQQLLSNLLKSHKANNISFEDLPVDDTLRNFFQNPNKYIQ